MESSDHYSLTPPPPLTMESDNFLYIRWKSNLTNIPILPMAFLTFADAKVVAPPIQPSKYPAHTVQIIKCSPLEAHMKSFSPLLLSHVAIPFWVHVWWVINDDATLGEMMQLATVQVTKVGYKSIMMSHQYKCWNLTVLKNQKQIQIQHMKRTKLKRPPLTGGA